jgi:two-component system phosphate regulon response regulator PhoB/two-component system alkaline phosphatase synthesis response regulator PhoP
VEASGMAKVLVVEDDRFLISAYRAKLSKSGFEVQLAGDGVEALAALKSFIPDVILLDLVMPRMDGFATLEAIKKQETLKNIPIIVTSNLGQKEDIDKAMQLGATDFMIKSDFSMEELIARIQSVQAEAKAA